jgi:hypothetical protein
MTHQQCVNRSRLKYHYLDLYPLCIFVHHLSSYQVLPELLGCIILFQADITVSRTLATLYS